MPSSVPRLRDVLAASASAYIGFLTHQGKSRNEAIDDAGEKFPSLSSAQLGEAARFARQAEIAGGKTEGLGRNRALTDANIPINDTLPDRYRYTATAVVAVEDTGRTEYRTVAIDSSERMTRGAIESLVAQQAATYMRPDGSPKAPSGRVSFEITGVTIDRVERQG